MSQGLEAGGQPLLCDGPASVTRRGLIDVAVSRTAGFAPGKLSSEQRIFCGTLSVVQKFGWGLYLGSLAVMMPHYFARSAQRFPEATSTVLQ